MFAEKENKKKKKEDARNGDLDMGEEFEGVIEVGAYCKTTEHRPTDWSHRPTDHRPPTG